MKKHCLWLYAASCLALGSTTLFAQDNQPVASYQVRYVGNDQFQVDATFAVPTDRLDLNSHDGSQRPNSQAESVRSLQAFDANNKPVPIAFAGHGTWELKQGAASRISYRLIADHDLVTWIAGKDEVASKFDKTFFFAGDAFFLINYDWPARPINVDFKLPKGWMVTSPWTSKGTVFTADNADNLGTNAFSMGQDKARQSTVGDLQLTWLSDSRIKAADQHLMPLLDTLPKAYTRFWDGSPGNKLTVFFLSDPDTDGVAFRNSFAMRLATPLRDSERVIWEHTFGHEIMHVWMNNSNDGVRITGDGSAYWFTEGFTDYLTVKLMRQSGLIDESLLQQRIANQIRRYQIGKRLSPDVSLAAAGKQKHKNWELIYGGGAMFALLLDAELSQQSPTAFRDALRKVQHNKGVAYDNERMLATLDASTNGRASALMARLNKGLTLGEIRSLLAKGGVSVEGFASDEVYVTLQPCNEAGCASSFLRP